MMKTIEKLARILFFIVVAKPLLSFVLGVNVYGRRHLPRQGQFIMIANHNSHLDTLALLNLFPLGRLDKIRPVAAEDYFSANRLLSVFSRVCFNILPIPRAHITKSNNPIKRMCAAIEAGDSLIVFPEGSRGQPEEMAEFQTGIAHLIQKFPELPVIPIYMAGMGRSLPKGEFILVPFFCDLIVGEPLFPTGGKDDITHTLETAVHQLRNTLENS